MNTKENSFDPNAIIAGIHWDLVGNCLFPNEKGELKREQWKEQEKRILRRRIQLMVETNLKELRCDHWLLQMKRKMEDEKDLELRIVFIPFDLTFRLEKGNTFQRDSYEKNMEWKSLHGLLYQYMDQEEFEICEKIKRRMLEIVEEMG